MTELEDNPLVPTCDSCGEPVNNENHSQTGNIITCKNAIGRLRQSDSDDESETVQLVTTSSGTQDSYEVNDFSISVPDETFDSYEMTAQAVEDMVQQLYERRSEHFSL